MNLQCTRKLIKSGDAVILSEGREREKHQVYGAVRSLSAAARSRWQMRALISESN